MKWWYTPPESPLNPTELVWGSLKQHLRNHKLKNLKELKAGIKQFWLTSCIHVHFFKYNKEKLDLVHKSIDKDITMDGAIASTKYTKQQKVMQDTFAAEVVLSSWDEAVTSLPQFVMHTKKKSLPLRLCLYYATICYISYIN